MRKYLLNQLIITVVHWEMFGGEKLERQFADLIGQVMEEEGLTFDEAVALLEREVKIDKEVAA